MLMTTVLKGMLCTTCEDVGVDAQSVSSAESPVTAAAPDWIGTFRPTGARLSGHPVPVKLKTPVESPDARGR